MMPQFAAPLMGVFQTCCVLDVVGILLIASPPFRLGACRTHDHSGLRATNSWAIAASSSPGGIRRQGTSSMNTLELTFRTTSSIGIFVKLNCVSVGHDEQRRLQIADLSLSVRPTTRTVGLIHTRDVAFCPDDPVAAIVAGGRDDPV